MKEKTKEVLLTEQLFLEYKSGSRAKWKENCDKDRKKKFDAWSDGQRAILEARGQMAIPVNEIFPAIGLIIAQLTENDPRFSAIGRERSDIKVASYIADLFLWIWDISKGRSKINKFVKDVIEIGMGALFVYIDPHADNGKGEIKFKDLNAPNELYIDPSSEDPDASDAPHIIISKILSEEKIKVMYPTVNLADAEQSSEIEGSDSTSTLGQIQYPSLSGRVKHYRVYDRYTKIKIKRFHVYDPVSGYENVFNDEQEFQKFLEEPAVIKTQLGGDTYITKPREVEEALKVYNEYGELFHFIVNPEDPYAPPIPVKGAEYEPYAVPGMTTKLTVVTKGQLIDEGVIKLDTPLLDRIQRVLSIGGVQVVDEVLPLRDYPIVTCMLHHDRTPFPLGDIRLTAPLQEELDKIDNLIITYFSNITNLKIIVQKNSGQAKEILSKLGKAGTDVIEIDWEADHAPIFVQYPPLNNGIFQQRENIIRQIQRIIGSYSFQDGDASSAPRTLGGTDRIDEMMQRRSLEKKRRIEDSLNQVAKVISQYIPYVYTEEKEIRITQPNHADPKIIVFNKPEEVEGQVKLINDIITHEYDVRIIANSMLPSNNAQRLGVLMNAYQNQVIKDNRPILELLELPDTDKLIEREDILKNMQSLVNELQTKIKEQEGLLQTLKRENIQKDQKVEQTKAKAELDILTGKVKNAVELGTQRINDQVKQTKKDNNTSR